VILHIALGSRTNRKLASMLCVTTGQGSWYVGLLDFIQQRGLIELGCCRGFWSRLRTLIGYACGFGGDQPSNPGLRMERGLRPS
jgi:hypothetical protein